MEPSGAPQPPQNAAYKTEGNPVTTNPAEAHAAHQNHTPADDRAVAERTPGHGINRSSDLRNAVPSSLGWGTTHGATPAGAERFGRTADNASGRHGESDGEQMRAPAEGRVADAVENKPGAGGSQPDLAGDLDRKKREQAEARSAMKEERRQGRISDGGAGAGVVGGVET